MINKDKYLKNNVSAEELAREIVKYYFRTSTPINLESTIREFFNKEATPTLTEDERVILKNIDTRRYPTIKRTKIGEIIVISNAKCGDDIMCYLYCYDHLFKFIKERRRILNTRIIRG